MWVEGCGRTRRDATLRYVTLFSLLAVSYRRCPSNRGKEERQKVGRVDALLRRLGRPAGFTCADARGRVKEKKGSRLPTLWTHTSTCIPRGKKDEASVKKRRVGVALVGGVCETSGRLRKGGKEGREKDVAKGCRVAYARLNKGKHGRRRIDEGACREGKDVDGEGRNRSP